MKFSEFIRLDEVVPMGGMPMPPMGGAMGAMGRPPLPPPGGGLGMPPPGGGLGAPPLPPPGAPPGMPGAPGQPPSQPPTEIKTKDVWSLLEKLLSGETSADQKKDGEGVKPKPSILRSA